MYVEYNGDRQFPAEHSVTTTSTDAAAVFYGIDRARLAEMEAGVYGVTDDSSDTTLEAVYAMPYFGSDNFKTAGDAAELIASDEYLGSFCLALQNP